MPRLGAFVSGLSLILMTACSSSEFNDEFNQVDVALADIGFAQAGLLEQEINLILRFTNPNPVAIDARGLRFDMTLDDTDFAKGVHNGDIKIPALGELSLPLSVRVSTADLIDRLVDFGSGDPLPYAFDGTLFVDQFGTSEATNLPFAGDASIRLPDIEALLNRFGTFSQ